MPASLPPRLEALLEEALAPYRRLWPEHVLAAFRDELLVTLQMHPAARRLLTEARMGLEGSSGEVHLIGDDVEGEAAGSVRRAGAK